ncbi:STAS domain-containing protein [Streptomyces tauricus]|uniref:STAS domain-containing protein n=1 Tax=Streptomyces tauricus TaxID=68274 RepID=UPI003829B823
MTDTHRNTPSSSLSIDQSTVNGIQVLTLHGEIDQPVAHLLDKALSCPASTTPPRIVADLSDVTFMDSSGINIFISAHHRASNTQGWLRIAGAQQAIQRILHIVGVDQIIECHPTLEEALHD